MITSSRRVPFHLHRLQPPPFGFRNFHACFRRRRRIFALQSENNAKIRTCEREAGSAPYFLCLKALVGNTDALPESTCVNVYLVLFIQQLIASSTHLIGKSLTTDINPLLVVLLRACFTISAFGIWIFFNRKRLPAFDRADLPRLMLLGLINIPVNQLLFLSGLKHTTPPNASLLYALTPAFVFAIALVRRTEKATLWKLLGIGAALTGAAIVLFERGVDFGSEFFLGNVLVFFASLSWAFYTIMGRRFIVKYGAFYATALTMFSGFAMYLPVYFVSQLFFTPVETSLADISPSLWLQLFYIGVITSGVGYGLWYYALSRIEASKVAVFNNCQPIMTTVLAIVFLSQTPTPIFLVGGTIAIIGVILTQKG